MLEIEIKDESGIVVDVVEIPDPRHAWCRAWNEMNRGTTATPAPRQSVEQEIADGPDNASTC